MITQTAISDKAACLIAKKYVFLDHWPGAGERVYMWEEESAFAPPDDKPYLTFLMKEIRIDGAEVVSRKDEQIQVNVTCTTLQADGNSEKDKADEEDEFYEEEHVIFCYLEPDAEGRWFVSEAEE